MSHAWWHFLGKSPEEKRLEELRAKEAGIMGLGEGAMELKKNELKQIQEEINKLKIDNPDNETIQSSFQQEDQGGGITDIVIEAGKTEAAMKAKEVIDSIDQTGFLSSQIDPMDLRNIAEALAAGDTEQLSSIFYNEVDQLQQSAPAAVVSALGLGSNPLGNAIAAGNLANNAVQKFATLSDVAAGIDIPGDNIFSSGIEGALNFANRPVQFGAEKFGEGITGISGDYNNLIQNILSTKPVQTASDVIQYPFDILYNFPGITDLNPFRKKDEPDPPVVIQQPIVNPRPDSTPIFTPPPATSNEAEVDYGGSGGGSGGSYGGGEDFGSPFAPSPPRGPDLTNRANGGLVSVSRYLKGR